MAFQSLVEDSRKMNAKMIAMGQSIDIQKMPRPKVGTQAAQRQAMYTPSGTDVEKMLYPKNFKPRTFDPEIEKSNSEITAPKADAEQLIDNAMIEAENTAEQKIIGDYEGNDATIIAPTPKEEIDPQEMMQKCFSAPAYTRCKHYKAQGDRAFCKEYLSLCAKEKCPRPKM